MKKRGFVAIIMAMFFVFFTLNVFSDETGTDANGNSGTSTSPGNDIQGNSAADVNGVYVPE
jgi:hypothetical protein